ncbi:helix-turn-helix domain-containing protein [Paenibacillus sp. P22]|uniref:helix-turn-helix domain-containing protein n=1 Tax=Paenibacillus sp. P22 TaxID=483908 RepID=UPI001E3FE060|nr:helix-turn-helix domain-containing protein [Paenibacillus sp. P22]
MQQKYFTLDTTFCIRVDTLSSRCLINEMVIIMDLKTFGIFFSRAREESGFKSQRELADKSGVSHSTINRIEAGTHRASPDTLRQLADFLRNVTYEEMLQRLGYTDHGFVVRESSSPYNVQPAKDIPEQDYRFFETDGVQFIARSQKNLSPEAFRKMQELAKKAREIFDEDED